MVSFYVLKVVPYWEALKNESYLMHSWNPAVNWGWSGWVSICRSYRYPKNRLLIMNGLIYLSFYLFTVFRIHSLFRFCLGKLFRVKIIH